MNFARALLTMAACLALLGAAPRPANVTEDANLAEVLANPGEYEGRQLRLHGFLILTFEGNALWVTEQDFRRERYDKALALELSPAQAETHSLSGKRAFVQGEVVSFDENRLYRAGLARVSAIEPDPTDNRPARPWIDDPTVLLLLAVLGFVGLVFGMLAFAGRVHHTVRGEDDVSP